MRTDVLEATLLIANTITCEALPFNTLDRKWVGGHEKLFRLKYQIELQTQISNIVEHVKITFKVQSY